MKPNWFLLANSHSIKSNLLIHYNVWTVIRLIPLNYCWIITWSLLERIIRCWSVGAKRKVLCRLVGRKMTAADCWSSPMFAVPIRVFTCAAPSMESPPSLKLSSSTLEVDFLLIQNIESFTSSHSCFCSVLPDPRSIKIWIKTNFYEGVYGWDFEGWIFGFFLT